MEFDYSLSGIVAALSMGAAKGIIINDSLLIEENWKSGIIPDVKECFLEICDLIRFGKRFYQSNDAATCIIMAEIL